MNDKKLKPVLFIQDSDKSNYYRNNLLQQNLLLKALEVTTNPEELKKMIGVRTVAEVYRTLDKLAIRKEYHEVLARKGLDLDNIVEGIKNTIEDTPSYSVKLKGYQTLLRSLGLDRYEETENKGSATWEDTILKIVENSSKQKELPEKAESVDYEVITPEIPEEEMDKIEEEEEIGKSLYER